MILLNRSEVRVFVYQKPIDMRHSFERLCFLVEQEMRCRLERGHVFLFLGNHRRRLKALYFDGSGLVLVIKRMEKYQFLSVMELQENAKSPTKIWSLSFTVESFAELLKSIAHRSRSGKTNGVEALIEEIKKVDDPEVLRTFMKMVLQDDLKLIEEINRIKKERSDEIAATQMTMEDRLVVLRRLVFGRSSEQRKSSDRRRRSEDDALLLESQSLVPPPKESQVRKLDAEVKCHEMSEAALKEEAAIRELPEQVGESRRATKSPKRLRLSSGSTSR